MERRGNIGFDKCYSLEGDQALETLNKEYHALVTNFFSHQNYFPFTVYFIEIGIQISEIGLILPLGCL